MRTMSGGGGQWESSGGQAACWQAATYRSGGGRRTRPWLTTGAACSPRCFCTRGWGCRKGQPTPPVGEARGGFIPKNNHIFGSGRRREERRGIVIIIPILMSSLREKRGTERRGISKLFAAPRYASSHRLEQRLQTCALVDKNFLNLKKKYSCT